MTGPIEVVIDELVLHGVDPLAAGALTNAMHQRLEEHASASGANWVQTTADVLLARQFRTPAGSPAQLGIRIADSLWSSVTRTAQVPQ